MMETPVTVIDSRLSSVIGASYYLLAKAHVQETVRRGGKAKGACKDAAAPKKGASATAAGKSTEDPGEKTWYFKPTT